MSADLLVRVRGLVREFPSGVAGAPVRAVDGVELDVARGSSAAIVGESGCGKTTLARCLTLALRPTAGMVEIDGGDPWTLGRAELRRLRARIALVQQNPTASLDPSMEVEDVVAEPLRTHGWSREATRARVPELLDLVALPRAIAARRPYELSGGQAQRVAIARAIALEPLLVVLDEPTSALDVSVQAQVLNLLLELRDRLGLTYVFVSHDLAVVEHVADRVAVMYLGRIVELGDARPVFERPRHPYTVALRSATPVLGGARQERIVLRGDLPSPVGAASGCRFRPRCWLWEELDRPAVCLGEMAPLTRVGERHLAACHFADELASRPYRAGDVSASMR